MRVRRRDEADAGADRELREDVVARLVERRVVVEQLDDHVVTAERLDETGKLAPRRGRPLSEERRGHGAAPAAGEDAPVAGVGPGEDPEVESRPPLLPSREMGPGDRRRQPGVPLGIPRQHDEVGGRGIDRAGPRLGPPGAPRRQRELGAEDGRQRDLPGGGGEADDAVAPVVVGERERLEAETRRLLGELLGARGAVEEAEVRMAVQLRVGHPAPEGLATLRRRLLADQRAPRGGGRVAVTPSRETALELGPGDDRVERTDRTTISNICSIC